MIFSTKNHGATPGKSISALAALIVLAISQPWSLAGKENDVLPANEIAEAKTKSLTLLRDIAPTAKSTTGMKIMETPGGIVRWGHLFGGEEIAALVSVPIPQPAEAQPEEHYPGYLVFFTWEKGRWTFRQCFNANYVSLDHCASHPVYYLQASRQTGLYDGDYLSWSYDAAAKKLVPTGFDQWGPFYIAGNYLCTTRGFERIHHDITTWIYSYSNGKQGPLLASYNENDNGNGDEYFTITIPDAKSGKMKSWAFDTDEKGLRILVASVERDTDSYPDADTNARRATLVAHKGGGLSSRRLFEFLTGLNADLLNPQWRDKAPGRPTREQLDARVTGAPEIVRMFQQAVPKTNASQ